MMTRRSPGKKFSPAGFLIFAFGAAASACAVLFEPLAPSETAAEIMMLRIYDRKKEILYAEAPAKVNSRLFFGWIHSLEKIPWNEYYHLDEKGNLVLDAIDFPAFGAGIPADAGRVCYVRDGLIHMEEIGQVFTELVWLNSHTATREIMLDGRMVTRGADLPHHTEIWLRIEKGERHGTP
ncbi:MAG: DUF1850 domain-containing protein [Desulfovibrionaceae bacterium]|nr:DUF1850 domain-containing protein [Desulfovibrionaceae bacterium]